MKEINQDQIEEKRKKVETLCDQTDGMLDETVPGAIKGTLMELKDKTKKLKTCLSSNEESNSDKLYEAIIEAEEASDAAKQAAEQSTDLDESVKNKIFTIHKELHHLKTDMAA